MKFTEIPCYIKTAKKIVGEINESYSITQKYVASFHIRLASYHKKSNRNILDGRFICDSLAICMVQY
ncbi:MAG: hypothetical protein RR965_08955, partial [Enterococcus sp.]